VGLERRGVSSGQRPPRYFATSVSPDGRPEGVFTPGAPRTVHDPLESHGSRCPAVAMA
jgi:hypothetical protein